MSLNAQCWNCRWRRVRCDSHSPVCNKCTAKGVFCYGYSKEKPLKWRHRIVQQQQELDSSRTPPLLLQLPPNDDCVPLNMAHEIVSYYNSMIVPDLSADSTCSYNITTSDWASLGEPTKHLYVCVVALHKIVRNYESIKTNQMLLYRHKASAARQLQQMIRTSSGPQYKPYLLRIANMFIGSEIQESAYGAWRTHVEGAKALVTSWIANPRSYDDFDLYNIAVVDIYGTTMAPSKLLSEKTLTQHRMYLNIIGQLDVDVTSTLTPIPADILDATIAINIYRSFHVVDSKSASGASCQEVLSPAATLDSLQRFDPHHWASTLVPVDAKDTESWALLATCFRTATMLYFFQSCPHFSIIGFSNGFLSETRNIAYQALFAAITSMFERRLCGGTHYKFILWPIAICGVESVVRKQHISLRYLCQALEMTTLDLGTLAMREAASFLIETWAIYHERSQVSGSCIEIEWDTIFRNAPIFLM